MSISWPSKDPDEVLDYELDWSLRLAGDTIVTSTWTVPSTLTKGADSVSSGGYGARTSSLPMASA